MEALFFDLYYFSAMVVGSYLLLWIIALGYAQSSKSSIQIERSVLQGWLLATTLHILGVVVLFILFFTLFDFSLLIIQLVAGSICLIIDMVLIFRIVTQIKSLPKF